MTRMIVTACFAFLAVVGCATIDPADIRPEDQQDTAALREAVSSIQASESVSDVNLRTDQTSQANEGVLPNVCITDVVGCAICCSATECCSLCGGRDSIVCEPI